MRLAIVRCDAKCGIGFENTPADFPFSCPERSSGSCEARPACHAGLLKSESMDKVHRFFVQTDDGRVFLVEEVWETLQDRFGILEPIHFNHGTFRILDMNNLDMIGTATQAPDDQSVFFLWLDEQDHPLRAW